MVSNAIGLAQQRLDVSEMKLFYVKFEHLKKPGPTNLFAIVADDQVHLTTIASTIGSEFVMVGEPTQLSKDWK